MKKIVFVLLLLLCHLPIMAQGIPARDSLLLADSFMKKNEGKYQEALDGFLKVGQNTKKQRTENERQMYVCSQMMAVVCYQSMKQYENAYYVIEKLLNTNINKDEKKALLPPYVKNGFEVAKLYGKPSVGRYSDARDIYTKILPYADDKISQRILPLLPLTWYYEGAQFFLEQKFEQALHCMEKACDGFKKIGSAKDELRAWYEIGFIRKFLYDLKGTMDAFQQAASLAASSKNDAKLMEILKEQCFLSEQFGDNEQTWAIGQRMDSLAAATDDKKLSFVYYNYLGDEAKKNSYYDLAEKWYRKNDPYISQLDDSYFGADKIKHYSNLLYLYIVLEKWDDALRCAMLYKDASQRIIKESDKDYYSSYGSIVDVYKGMGDSIKCFQNLDTLFLSLERKEEPRELKELYVKRALCYYAFHNYELALADFKKADELLATKYDEDDGDRIELFPMMGGIEHKLGNHAAGERLYRKYADGMKKIYGEHHLEYIRALGYLANAEGFSGKIEAACDDYTTAVDELRRLVRQRLPYLSTADRDAYWKSVSELFQNMTPFALEAKEYQTAFTRTCYDGLILSKAFLLETERSTFNLIKSNGTDADLLNFKMIAFMLSKIREWETKGSSRTDSILELTPRVRQLEEQLSKQCRSYGDMTAFMNIGYGEIKDNLNDGDVLIDFTDYVSGTRGRVYAAYLVDNRQENPLLQKLFAESKIDSLQVSYPDQYYESPYAETLYQLLWMPFKDKVNEGATVYYVPSQLLFQIALESIPTEDGTLLGEHYHFVRLSSARELVNLNKRLDMDFANTNAVLYGGLLYDLEANDWETEAKKYDVSSFLAVRGDVLRGDSVYKPLPGSKKEVDIIEYILKSHQLKVESYTGKQGTEESFVNMSGKAPQILHIATHGFFYTPDEAKEIDYLRGYEDAMSLSGLVMSGGNAAWCGRELPEGVLGGILTASNIARLDLSNTKLTVLSACQSGKGQATPEGLYGLQRAFKKAGVKTMIMSLWNVSDVVGAEFMNLFYEYLLDKDNHFDKRIAFDKAKSAVREKYPEPFYWACFVMLD